LYNVEQVPQNDMTGGDFVIAKLRGGKGLPDKGWEEVKPEATPNINNFGQIIGNQVGKTIINTQKLDQLHIGDVIHKS